MTKTPEEIAKTLTPRMKAVLLTGAPGAGRAAGQWVLGPTNTIVALIKRGLVDSGRRQNFITPLGWQVLVALGSVPSMEVLHAEALEVNAELDDMRLEAVPVSGPAPQSVQANSEGYFTRGCGADVSATTARLVAEDAQRFAAEVLPAQVIAARLSGTRFLLEGALERMRSAAADVKALSDQEAELLQQASRAAQSGTLPDWARPLVSVQGSEALKPQDGAQRVAYAVGDSVGLPSPYGQSKRYRVEHVQPAQRMAAVILGGQLKWFTFAELRNVSQQCPAGCGTPVGVAHAQPCI